MVFFMVQASFPDEMESFPLAVEVDLDVEPEMQAGNKRAICKELFTLILWPPKSVKVSL
jgi:hypothetical protein